MLSRPTRTFLSSREHPFEHTEFDIMHVRCTKRYETKKQRREAGVHKLLDQLPPDTIVLNPEEIGTVDRTPQEVLMRERKLVCTHCSTLLLLKPSYRNQGFIRCLSRQLSGSGGQQQR